MSDRPEVLTGQVPAYPNCPEHAETDHGGLIPWCNRCGWNREHREKVGRANGGWGAPSGTVR